MDLSGRTILVTGGAGFIGSHLVDALRPGRIRVFDDLSTGTRDSLGHLPEGSGVEVVIGDVRDASAVEAAMRGVEIVFHLACRGVRHSIANPRENHEVNATGTLNVLQAARAQGVGRVIHVSSSEVYGTARVVPMSEDHPCFPETAYGAAKLAGEAYARAYHRTYGLPTVIVRPFNNFGPRSHFEGDAGEVIPRFAVRALNGRRPLIFGDGAQTRDFIYVGDTAEWLVRLARVDEAVGRTINLGSGRETAVRDVARIICEEAGRPDLAPEYHAPRPGDVRRHLADTRCARDLLGFEPKTSLRAGVRHLIEALASGRDPVSALLARTPDINW